MSPIIGEFLERYDPVDPHRCYVWCDDAGVVQALVNVAHGVAAHERAAYHAEHETPKTIYGGCVAGRACACDAVLRGRLYAADGDGGREDAATE